MKSATLKTSWSLKRQSLSVVVTRETVIVLGLGFYAQQRAFGSSLPGCLLSDDPVDRQLLTSDSFSDFQRTNDMRSAAQRALFKQNSTRAAQAAVWAHHRSQPRDDVNCWSRGHGVAKQQVDWKERLGRTRSCRCCVGNEDTSLDFHAWLFAEVFERTGAQSDRRRMARRRVDLNPCDRTAQQSPEKWTTWLRRCRARGTTNGGASG